MLRQDETGEAHPQPGALGDRALSVGHPWRACMSTSIKNRGRTSPGQIRTFRVPFAADCLFRSHGAHEEDCITGWIE
jgi:hypothetical protein